MFVIKLYLLYPSVPHLRFLDPLPKTVNYKTSFRRESDIYIIELAIIASVVDFWNLEKIKKL